MQKPRHSDWHTQSILQVCRRRWHRQHVTARLAECRCAALVWGTRWPVPLDTSVTPCMCSAGGQASEPLSLPSLPSHSGAANRSAGGNSAGQSVPRTPSAAYGSFGGNAGSYGGRATSGLQRSRPGLSNRGPEHSVPVSGLTVNLLPFCLSSACRLH